MLFCQSQALAFITEKKTDYNFHTNPDYNKFTPKPRL